MASSGLATSACRSPSSLRAPASTSSGYDVDQSKVDSLTAGKSYIPDVPSEELAEVVKAGTFRATTDQRELADVDIIDICVPTPLRKTPRPGPVLRRQGDRGDRGGASQGAAGHSRVDDLSRHDRRSRAASARGRRPEGRPGFLPRVLARARRSGQPDVHDQEHSEGGRRHRPGRAPTWPRRSTSQVVETVVQVGNTRVAEMVKLLENTFRAVNIGLVNEIALMCHRLNIDVWEVIDAAKTKPFGFMPFYPGPGLGGHCIPDRSVLSVVEGAAERLRVPLHRAGRQRERRDAGVRRRAGDRCAELRKEEHQRLENSRPRRWPTRRMSETCASRRRSTSSSCCIGAARR